MPARGTGYLREEELIDLQCVKREFPKIRKAQFIGSKSVRLLGRGPLHDDAFSGISENIGLKCERIGKH